MNSDNTTSEDKKMVVGIDERAPPEILLLPGPPQKGIVPGPLPCRTPTVGGGDPGINPYPAPGFIPGSPPPLPPPCMLPGTQPAP